MEKVSIGEMSQGHNGEWIGLVKDWMVVWRGVLRGGNWRGGEGRRGEGRGERGEGQSWWAGWKVVRRKWVSSPCASPTCEFLEKMIESVCDDASEGTDVG